MSKYRWISWVQPTEDYRPLSYPPGQNVLGWWKTGESTNGHAILVAQIKAVSEEDGEAVILKEWPEATDWRFNIKCTAVPPGDRFPLQDWMVGRYRKENTDETH